MSDDARDPDAARLLTVAGAAQQAGVSRHIISSWITRGQLAAVRIAGRRYIRPDDLRATQARVHAGAVTPLPEPRGAGALVLLDRNLHFFGGTGPDRFTAVADHWVRSVDSDDGWTKAAPLPEASNHLNGAALDGKVYAIAGQAGHDKTSVMKTGVFAWDPATDTWSSVAALPSPRSHTNTVVFDGQIIVLGGLAQHGGDYKIADVTAYDP